jgi:hypothetical protein
MAAERIRADFLSPEVQHVQKAFRARAQQLHMRASSLRDQSNPENPSIMAQVTSLLASEFDMLAEELHNR